MNRFQTSIVKNLQKIIGFVLLFISTYAVQAQKPVCNFNDTEGYFYNWDFDANNLTFEFVLENNTGTEVKNKITSYEIVWGDGETTNITNDNFPVTHTYGEGVVDYKGAQHDLIIKINYDGTIYEYPYIVYNTKPKVNTDIIDGENGCEGQEFKFELTGYEDNPPDTQYEWNFGDGTKKIYWTLSQLITNNGIISHMFNKSSCISEGTGEHYDAGATPFIDKDKFLLGSGKKAGPIVISKNIELKLKLLVNTTEENIEIEHNGCANQTFFNFINESDYGLNKYLCRVSDEHEWTVYKIVGTTKEEATLNTDYKYSTGNADSKGNISIVFLQTGNYSIKFSMNNSCSHLLEQETGVIDIYDNINTTTYAPKNFCLADDATVEFTTTENDDIEAIQETVYYWTVNTNSFSFVDGTSNTSQNPHFQFTQAGKFTVTLNKISLCGEKKYDYVVEVSNKPAVVINTPIGISNGGHCGAFTFTPSATYTDNGKETFEIDNNEIVEYEWSFDNNGTTSTSALKNPTQITFSKIGPSSISLRVRNSQCGWSDVDKIEFEIFAIPTPSFTRIDPSCEDEEIVYNALPNSMKTYTWLFGDGNTGSGQNTANTFMTAGTYTNKLTVTSNDGCENSISKDIRILKKATINAGQNGNICSTDNSYSLINASVSESTSILWKHDGDGEFSNPLIANPIYTLGADDKTQTQIKLTLTAIGNSPCGEESSFMYINITPKPSISIGLATDKICENSAFIIKNVSTDNTESLLWSSDKGGVFSNRTIENPTYTPPTNFSGIVHLKLTAIAKEYCNDIHKEIELTVKPLPIVEAGTNFSICENEKIDLVGTSSTTTHTWSTLGDGDFKSETQLITEYTPGINDIKTGSVTLKLEAIGDAFCSPISDDITVQIVKNSIANAGKDDFMCKTKNSYTINAGSTIDQANANYYQSIEWTHNGTGRFIDPSIISATYEPSIDDLDKGSVELTLKANPLNHCSDIATSLMTLSFINPPELTIGADLINCQANTIDLNASANYTSSTLWTTLGNGTFEDETKLVTKYIPDPSETGIVTLSLTAQAIGDCSPIKRDLQLTLIAKPIANAGIDEDICADGSFNLTANNINGAKVISAQSVLWEKLGDADGSFDTPNSINAIYTPGPKDIAKGSVVLKLTAYPYTECANSHSDEMTLNITPLAIANAGDDDAICQGGSYDITTASAQNSSKFKWKTSSASGYFIEGETLTPTYHPGTDDIGETTLSLVVYGQGKCSPVQDDMILSITPAPTVILKDKTDICEDGTYLATGTVINYSPSYNWTTTGLGTITDENTLEPTYSAKTGETGDVDLCLTVQGNGLCTEKTTCTKITIVPHPSVNAGKDDEVCADQIYQMNVGDQVDQVNAKSWSTIEYKTDGDGNFQDQNGLSANYILGENDKLNGQVKLWIKANSISPCNEFVEDDMMLTITPTPIVEAGNNDEICENDDYNLLNSSVQNTSSLLWRTNDGGSFSNENSLHPIYTPDIGKTGIVKLELIGNGEASCNSSSDILSLNIIPLPHVKTDKDKTICIGKTYELSTTTASSFSTVLWSSEGTGEFDDKTKLKAIYIPSEADYTSGSVLLTINVGGLTPCTLGASDKMLLSFVPAPTVSAGENTQICQTTGTYTIEEKSATNPLGAYAENYSSIIWETTGTGSIQNNNTITPTYIAATGETGIIQLKLIAYGNANCNPIEKEMLLNIVPTPVANFTTGNSCIGNPIQFKDLSTAGVYTITSWLWTFEGGTTSTLQNPIHQFDEAKDYKVSLLITNSEGCTKLVEKTITVNPLPKMLFSHEDIAAINIPVEFKNKCLNAISYLWDFGDGNTSTHFEPQHTYTNKGFYTIKLTAESKDGCLNSITSKIEIIGKPEARFSKTADGCGPLSVEFTNLSTGKFTTYLWDFGNGTQSTEANPEPIIYEQGVLSVKTYNVNLTLENKAGVSIFEDQVVVKPQPIPQFEILPTSSGCTPVVREIYNHSKGLPISYEFDFGDGTTYAYEAKNVERPFDHEFFTGEEKTIYPITLHATNECGTQAITKNMTVYPNTAVAVIKVIEDEGCAPFTVEFENLSTGAGDYLESDWTFENENVTVRDTEGKTMYHTFNKAGVYQVKLSVFDNCATDLTTREIIVHDAIPIDFEINARKFCMLEEIQLSIPESIINTFTNFTWDLGDGTISKETNIKHRFNKKGRFLIKLSALSKENACEKTQTKQLLIHQKPTANYSLSSNEGCEPFQVNFINNSKFTDYYQWDFKDGSKSSVKNPTHDFSQGNYSISLIAESVEGCLDTLNTSLISRPKPVADFNMSTNRSCIIPLNLRIENTSPDKAFNSYVWDFDNGSIRTDKQAIEETFKREGTYNIKLTAENQFHCTDILTKKLNIYTAPVAKYKTISKTSCQDELIEFVDMSTNNQYCYWTFSDGASCEGENASHVFKDYGKYDLTLKVVGNGNCSDELFSKNAILVYPKPHVSFSWENVNTPPEGINLSEGMSPPNNGLIQFTNLTEVVNKDWLENNKYTYHWDFDDFTFSQEKDPLHKYENNGAFHVKLTALSAYSCQNTISEPVEVDLMSSLFVPNAFNPGNPNPQVALFLPKGIGLHSYEIEILDRWGKVVWYSNQIKDGRPAEGWDGTRNGQALPQGIYIWKIRAIFKNGATWQGMRIDGKYHREGSITLIK